MKVDPLVCQVICMNNINHFTAVEIRTAYIVLANDDTLDGTNVRKFVYAELHKLVRRGWLNRLTSDTKGITRFKKTKLFKTKVVKSHIALEINSNGSTEQSIDLLNQLYKNINTHKAELLEGLGAMETYMELRLNHPELKDRVKPKYMAVQERNHILKGKIKALEELIKLIKET